MDSRLSNEDWCRPRGSPEYPRSIGVKILIPGLPQWSWDQRERGLFLLGSFLAAILVSLMTWGTSLGLGVLTFAFVTHVFSAVDAIRQNAFPGFGRLIPTVTTSAGLGTAFYAPALAMASIFAWPVAPEDRPREGYLVDRRAYASEDPRPGDAVWLRSRRGEQSKVARVVAIQGERVEWVGDEFRVNDLMIEDRPFPTSETPTELKLKIPDGHLMVYYPDDARRTASPSLGWEIVPSRQVCGRAWARSYPIWDRGLLR